MKTNIRFIVKFLGSLTFFCLVSLAATSSEEKDPLNSPMWAYLKAKYFPEIKEPIHSERIRVFTPEFAENPIRVPVSVDASELGNVKRMIVLADLNPIQKILEFDTGNLFKPSISFYFKIQQRSPLRVLAQTIDGRWHMNGNWIEATGGGCTVPAIQNDEGNWSAIGQTGGMLVGNQTRGMKLKMSVVHPMDTGLVSGIPEFYVEKISFSGKEGESVSGNLLLYQPISQDPLLSLSLLPEVQGGQINVAIRDSSGQVFNTKFNQNPRFF